MDTRGNQPLREMLAAEYALGTLRGAARRRFERWTRSDPELRALALQWSERLAPLADRIPSKLPPGRVWEAIEARLPGASARLQPQPVGWWDRLMLWRGLSAALAAVAVVAVGIALRQQPVVAPQGVAVESVPRSVATIADPKSGKPVAVVLASDRGVVTIKVADDVEVPEGKVLQLWIAPTDSPTMESMGLLLADARRRPEPVRAIDAAALARTKAFGLSLEPAGGSPQPTQVLGLGALVRVSG